jgi:glycosyltransferase involved in cell wall biosynthesis
MKPNQAGCPAPLRVLYFAGTHGDWGGAGRVLFTILSLLDRSRVEPIVALPREGPAQSLLDKLHIECLIWGGMTEYRSPIQYIGAIVRSLRWLRQREIDVIHMNRANDWRPAELVAARLARIPVVTVFHTVNLDRAPATRLSNVIAAVSEYVATHSDTQNVPVRAIHNAVSPQMFEHGRDIRRELGVGADDVLVTFAGQMRRIKGVELFIDAARRTIASNVRFLMVGECRQGAGIDDAYTEAELQELIENDRRILYGGYRDDMPDVYHSSDIVVVPSLWEEPFGLILIEAGAAGKPVIATRVGGIPEVVRDGVTGYLVPPENVELLAVKIGLLVSNCALRATMGAAARHYVKSRFSWQPVRELESLYESLASQRATAA